MNTFGKIFNCFFCLFFLCSCNGKKDNIEFYLQNDFNGNVVIVYNCVDGIIPELKNNVKQIYVPISGVVKIRQKINFGITDYKYFMLKKEEYLKLKIFSSFENHLNNDYYVGPGTVLSINTSINNFEKQYAFIFYVHKLKENLDNYSDTWIRDTLEKQRYFGPHGAEIP